MAAVQQHANLVLEEEQDSVKEVRLIQVLLLLLKVTDFRYSNRMSKPPSTMSFMRPCLWCMHASPNEPTSLSLILMTLTKNLLLPSPIRQLTLHQKLASNLGYLQSVIMQRPLTN
jgi:hypothetical protein